MSFVPSRLSIALSLVACSVLAAPSALANKPAIFQANSDGTIWVSELGPPGAPGMSPPVNVLDNGLAQTGSFFADFNGDGLTDYLGWNPGITFVALGASGPAMVDFRVWSSGAFYGNVANFVGDVNGDGMADMIAWNTTSVYVRLSTGSSFGPVQEWSANTAFYGGAGLGGAASLTVNYAADVNGDGRMDLVAWNATNIYALLSEGNFFSSPQEISSGAFYGNLADGFSPDFFTSVYDPHYGRVVDAPIAFDYGSAWLVTPSYGESQVHNPPTVGPNGNIAIDVNGDGYKDYLTIYGAFTGDTNSELVTVALNEGGGTFGPAITYSDVLGPDGGWGMGQLVVGGTAAP